MAENNCDNCGGALAGRRSFGFKPKQKPGVPKQDSGQDGDRETFKCFPCSLRHWPMVKRSLAAALVVGTVLTLLNQGDAIASGNAGGALYWKVPLTYCVPFIVATYGALTNSRR